MMMSVMQLLLTIQLVFVLSKCQAFEDHLARAKRLSSRRRPSDPCAQMRASAATCNCQIPEFTAHPNRDGNNRILSLPGGKPQRHSGNIIHPAPAAPYERHPRRLKRLASVREGRPVPADTRERFRSNCPPSPRCRCGTPRPRPVIKRDPVAEYHHQMATSVTPLFNKAVLIYTDNILKGLASTTVAQIEADPTPIVKQLNCDTTSLSASLGACADACTRAKDDLDTRLVQLVDDESALQKERTRLESEKNTHQASLVSHQQSLTQAKARETAAQTAVSAADAEYAKQWARLEDARRSCIGKRRRKRGGLGSWVKKNILKPLEKVACGVFNMGGIDNAKHARNLAGDGLADAKKHVAQVQGEMNGIYSRIRSANSKIANVDNESRKVQKQSEALQQLRTELVKATESAKMATLSVAVFWGRTKFLKDAVENMILFEEILGPLKSVSNHLKKSNLAVSGIEVDKATLDGMGKSLKLLNEKLPNYPFVDIATC